MSVEARAVEKEELNEMDLIAAGIAKLLGEAMNTVEEKKCNQ